MPLNNQVIFIAHMTSHYDKPWPTFDGNSFISAWSASKYLANSVVSSFHFPTLSESLCSNLTNWKEFDWMLKTTKTHTYIIYIYVRIHNYNGLHECLKKKAPKIPVGFPYKTYREFGVNFYFFGDNFRLRSSISFWPGGYLVALGRLLDTQSLGSWVMAGA